MELGKRGVKLQHSAPASVFELNLDMCETMLRFRKSRLCELSIQSEQIARARDYQAFHLVGKYLFLFSYSDSPN